MSVRMRVSASMSESASGSGASVRESRRLNDTSESESE